VTLVVRTNGLEMWKDLKPFPVSFLETPRQQSEFRVAAARYLWMASGTD
jgi:hypothetical protein